MTNTLARAGSLAQDARKRIGAVVYGQEEAVDLLLIAIATGGHALLEGVPGVGKTTLAKAVASASGLEFKRLQLTPDLMPSDVTGHSYYVQSRGTFDVRKGPVFTNILLADEINRAPPRTQAALLEVMEEQQVTIDGETHRVPDPFLVVATKNPIDVEGVYPLPEAQLDRFMLFIDLDYPPRAVEQGMLLGKLRTKGHVEPTPGLVTTLREALQEVHVHRDVLDYVLDVARATRVHPQVELGAGPRAAEHMLSAIRARAAIEGRAFVIPDDVKALAPSVLAHRLLLKADAEVRGLRKHDIVAQVLQEIPAPVEVTPHGAGH